MLLTEIVTFLFLLTNQGTRNGNVTSTLGSGSSLSALSGYPSSLSFSSGEYPEEGTRVQLTVPSSEEFHLNQELASGLVGFTSQGILQNWNTNQNHLNLTGSPAGQGPNSTASQMPQLSVSSSSPPPSGSHSPSVKVKSEPISPPRDLSQQHHQQQMNLALNRTSTPSHLSPGHPPLTPSTSSSPDPSGSSDYDEGPVHKRMRVTSAETSWPA